MIRSVVVVVGCLVGWGASSVAAEPLSTRDILSLDKFGKGVYGVSWCTDDTLTFVSGFSQGASNLLARGQDLTVNMLSLESGASRPLLVYQNSNLRVSCVLGGNFLFASGSSNLAYLPNEALNAQAAVRGGFSHFVEILREDDQAKSRRTFSLNTDNGGFDGPLMTDAAGNIYGRSSGLDVELKHIDWDAINPNFKRHLNYRVSYNGTDFTVFATTSNSAPRRPNIENVYGIANSTFRHVGSYPCATPRPGCPEGSTAQTIVYYTTASYATSKEPGPDGLLSGYWALYTAVVGKKPTIQHWPIIRAYASKHPYELAVVDVAIDARRCLVLLEQRRDLPSSRINGRLNLDLFVADCQTKDRRLEYGEPRKIAHQQGSFIWPQFGFYGDLIVVTDIYDISSQEEDQMELEKADSANARVCARFFSGSSAARVRRTNSICGLANKAMLRSGMQTVASAVSPNGKFVVFNGYKDQAPLIVGRDFRQDGRGPDWLTNEE